MKHFLLKVFINSQFRWDCETNDSWFHRKGSGSLGQNVQRNEIWGQLGKKKPTHLPCQSFPRPSCPALTFTKCHDIMYGCVSTSLPPLREEVVTGMEWGWEFLQSPPCRYSPEGSILL